MSKQETMFDTIKHPLAATLDGSEMEGMVRSQQALTMSRIARWLEQKATIHKLNGQYLAYKHIADIAEELEYLSTLPQTALSVEDVREWAS